MTRKIWRHYLGRAQWHNGHKCHIFGYMSNLHCPNCNHLIGTLDLAPAPVKTAPSTSHVFAWMTVDGWDGWESTETLYPRFAEWCSSRRLDPLSRRRFAQAAIAAGARWKKTNRGRLYSKGS